MHALFLAALMLAVPLAARAQSVQVDHVDIVDKGVYVVTTGDQTANATTPNGTIVAVTVAKNIQNTTAIQGKVGSEFGLRYVVAGAPAGADVSVDIVITYPAPGLPDPTAAKPIVESRFSRVKKIGETEYLGYGFDDDWEIVPGTWTFEIWYGGRMMASQAFTVSK
jgi:hypothetical protein